ncbi:hypothetical protein LUZ60_014044 [Juncus effusus]|nr:hypothetical protein LUZ60_014044 [Juncus effusus]
MNSGELSSSVCLGLSLPLQNPSSFDLEKTVCSHGLFMMAPNRWDPVSKTFLRPLRLSSSPSVSLPVMISRSDNSEELQIRVSGADSLAERDRQAILDQVRRMLRISEKDDIIVKGFQELHEGAKEKGFGRVFRSPTLFEDMVKCILLCNCTWPRTLSMARALCSLQKPKTSSQDFKPKTPQKTEQKRKNPKNNKISLNLETKFQEESSNNNNDNNHHHHHHHNNNNNNNNNEEIEIEIEIGIGDFPTAAELANWEATQLAARCKLGYRAQRIVSLAQSVVKGEINIKKLEEISACNDGLIFNNYDDLYCELLSVNGFGPFTCANVLMCMGFFHKIPVDTETIRHLKSFHKRKCTSSESKEIDAIYGKYAPYQFLAYWYELWDYYEETFGKTGEMSPSDYQLITATNMKTEEKVSKRRKY